MKANIHEEIKKLEDEICRGNEMISLLTSEIVDLEFEGNLFDHNRIGTLKKRIVNIIDANITRRLKIRKLKSKL